MELDILNPLYSISMVPKSAQLQQLTNYDIVDSLQLELSIVFLLFKVIAKPRITSWQTNSMNNQTETRNLPQTWGYYGSDGPETWSGYKSTCAGLKQSPIDIVPGLVEISEQGSIHFINYDVPTIAQVVNNGHTVNIEIVTNLMAISGGGLGSPYQVAQFHFHWGSNDSVGSEHTINGHAFPLEIHVVHFKQSYGTIADAATQPDGLAVLGALFEISTIDNPAFANLLNTFESVHNAKDSTMFTLMSLSNMLPTFTNYYRYSGSLTTPPCSQTVIWTISTDLVKISQNQLQKFRHLMSSEKDDNGQILPMVDNYRPVQALNNRRITSNVGV